MKKHHFIQIIVRVEANNGSRERDRCLSQRNSTNLFAAPSLFYSQFGIVLARGRFFFQRVLLQAQPAVKLKNFRAFCVASADESPGVFACVCVCVCVYACAQTAGLPVRL